MRPAISHLKRAEEFADLATHGGQIDVGDWSPDYRELLAAAQVHATIALALTEASV